MNSRLAAAALALGLATTALAAPPNMSLATYLERLKEINAGYAVARSACKVNVSNVNAREVCLADAMGQDHVAKADLEVAYRATERTLLEQSDARATAAFWAARERCGDLAFRLQPACEQEAKAAETAAKADARLRSKAAHERAVAAEVRALALARAHERDTAAQARARSAARTPGE